MGAMTQFLHHMDWLGFLSFILSGIGCLICLTVYELSHGWVAYRLGDPTAKLNGRLTLNPISHIDWVGLFLLLVVGVGWAKPVPVDMRNFRNPKRDMAFTALAGPVSNFLLSVVMLLVGTFLIATAPKDGILPYVLLFICRISVLSVGLGLFNLIPVPPLDGSKILFALLPDRMYHFMLRYEQYMILAVVLLAWSGFLNGILGVVMQWVMFLLCKMTGFPFELVAYYFF